MKVGCFQKNRRRAVQAENGVEERPGNTMLRVCSAKIEECNRKRWPHSPRVESSSPAIGLCFLPFFFFSFVHPIYFLFISGCDNAPTLASSMTHKRQVGRLAARQPGSQAARLPGCHARLPGCRGLPGCQLGSQPAQPARKPRSRSWKMFGKTRRGYTRGNSCQAALPWADQLTGQQP